MMNNWNISRRSAIIAGVVFGLFLLLLTFSIFKGIENSQHETFMNKTNPGGTGGDYWPPNTVRLDDSTVIKRTLGTTATEKLVAALEARAKKDIGMTNQPYDVTIVSGPGPVSPPQKWTYLLVMRINNTHTYKVTIDVNPDPDPTDTREHPVITIEPN